MLEALNVDPNERVKFIGDTDTGGFFNLKAGDQYRDLKGALDSGDYHDIKIVGFSEGAGGWYPSAL